MHIIDKQLEAYNKRDLKSFINCYSDDIQVFMLESNKLLTQGKEQLIKTMEDSFNNKPDSRTMVGSRIYQNNLVVDLEKIKGYIEGKTITTIAIYEIKDDLIAKTWFGGRSLD